MSIVRAIDIALKSKEKRGWDKLYFFFDVHETILYPDWGKNQPLRFYEHSKEVLQYFSKREDISIALYTCSYPKEIKKYIKLFQDNNIEFEYVNKNPDVENTGYGYYEDKPYFNVLFDDKAGFDAEQDWKLIREYLEI